MGEKRKRSGFGIFVIGFEKERDGRRDGKGG